MISIIRHICCALASIVRHLGFGRAKDDTVTVEMPIPGNRNKRRRKGSGVGVYENKVTGHPLVVVTLCPEEAATHGLKAGDTVKVLSTSAGLVIRHAEKGATITAIGASLRVQAGGLRLAPMPATPVRLSQGKNGDVVLSFGGSGGGGITVPAPVNDNGPETGKGDNPIITPMSELNGFRSLEGNSGKRRKLFLAANDNKKKAMATTGAGDACFAALFLVEVVLAAAGRSLFDVDFCTMREDGRYDLDLPPDLAAKVMVKHPRNPNQMLPVIGHIPITPRMSPSSGRCCWNGGVILAG